MARPATRRSSLPCRLLIVLSIAALLVVGATAQPAAEEDGAAAGADLQANVTAAAATAAPEMPSGLPETTSGRTSAGGSPLLPPELAPAAPPPIEESPAPQAAGTSSNGPADSGPSARQSAEDADARRVADFRARAAMEEAAVARGAILPGQYLVIFKTGTRRIAASTNRCT